MTSAWQQGFADLFQAIDRHHDRVQELTAKVKAAEGKATGHRGLLTVTVDASGDVTEVKFLKRDFQRMTAKELGPIIQETIAKARAEAADAVRKARGDMPLPAGVAADDLGSVRAGVDSVMSSLRSALPADMAKLLDGAETPKR